MALPQPDFIQIPTQLLSDSSLQPSDRILFGYVYWMTKMALMKCVASNATFSELAGISERAVTKGLRRLEDGGYISIIYQDESRRHRLEIVPLIAFSAIKPELPEPRPNKRSIQTEQTDGLDRTNGPHNKNHNKNTYKELVTNVTKAPAEPRAYGKPEINELFQYWEAKTGVGIQAKLKSNRNAANNLLKRYGADKLHQLIDGVALAQADRYAPRICDFTELQAKLTQLLTWGKTKMTTTTKERVVKI